MPNVEDISNIEFLPLGETAPTAEVTIGAPAEEETADTTEQTVDETAGGTQETQTEETDTQGATEQTTDTTETDTSQASTEDDTQTDTTDDAPVSIYQSMIDKAGISLDDRVREEILATEETDEGFVNVANTIAEQVVNQRFNGLMEQYPHTAAMLQYEMLGGNPMDYLQNQFPLVNYSEVEITEENVDTQKAIVADGLRLQGYEEEEITSQLAEYESAGILKTTAERNLKTLDRHQKKQQADFKAQQEAKQAAFEKEQKEVYDKTIGLIDGNKIELLPLALSGSSLRDTPIT